MDHLKDAVTHAVSELYAKNGAVTPSALIEAARPKNSPAHDAFEWDDHKAAHGYRLVQARQWIRRVEIIIGDRSEQLVHIHVQHGEGCYKPMSVVVANPDEYQSAKAELEEKVASAKRSYESLLAAALRHARRRPSKKISRGFALIEDGMTSI